MKFLVFNARGQANAAQRKIWAVLKNGYLGRGYLEKTQGVKRPGVGITERWAVPRKRLDGKWVMPHPQKSMLKNDETGGKTVEFLCMSGMKAHNVEGYSPDWFANLDDEVEKARSR